MGPGRDRTRDPWICSQTRICYQTRYRMRYAARYRLTEFSCTIFEYVLQNVSTMQKVSEFDQEIQQAHTADQNVAPWGRAT